MAYTGNIDIDRGVTGRSSYLNPELGTVYMYKDDPGIYFNTHGQGVSETVARLAGYDVEALARVRERKEKLAEFEADMERELRMATAKAPVILAKRGGFQIVGRAAGRADVQDMDGVTINAMSLTEEEARTLFNKLAPGGDVAFATEAGHVEDDA